MKVLSQILVAVLSKEKKPVKIRDLRSVVAKHLAHPSFTSSLFWPESRKLFKIKDGFISLNRKGLKAEKAKEFERAKRAEMRKAAKKAA